MRQDTCRLAATRWDPAQPRVERLYRNRQICAVATTHEGHFSTVKLGCIVSRKRSVGVPLLIVTGIGVLFLGAAWLVCDDISPGLNDATASNGVNQRRSTGRVGKGGDVKRGGSRSVGELAWQWTRCMRKEACNSMSYLRIATRSMETDMPETEDERQSNERTADPGRPENVEDTDGVTGEDNVRSPEESQPRPWRREEMENAEPYPMPEIPDEDDHEDDACHERTDDPVRPENMEDTDGVTGEDTLRNLRENRPRPWSQEEMNDAEPQPMPEISDEDDDEDKRGV